MKNNKMQACPGCSVNTWDRLSLTSGTAAVLVSCPLPDAPWAQSAHPGAAALLAGGVSAGFTDAGVANQAGTVGVHLEER